MAAAFFVGPGLLLGKAIADRAIRAIQQDIQNNPDWIVQPDAQNRLFKAYEDSSMVVNNANSSEKFKIYAKVIGLADALASAKAATTYTSEHKGNIDLFDKVNIGDDSLKKKLNIEGNAEAQAALTGINEALAVSRGTKNKLDDYTREMRLLCQYLADPNSAETPRVIRDKLHKLQSTAFDAIKAQQAAELQALKAQFDGPSGVRLRSLLGTGGGNASDAVMEKVKKDMVEAMQANHKTELDKFEKTTKETIQKTHDISSAESNRISFLARIHSYNKVNREIIEKLRAQNMQSDDSEVSIQFSSTNQKAMFKGISMQDVPMFESLNGRKITQTSPGVFEMNLPNRIFSPIYYSDWSTALKEDMSDIIQGVRAGGYANVKLEIKHKDPEHALNMAKAAYAAGREQGFGADKIHLVVNGKKLTANEIFKDSPDELRAIETKAAISDKQIAAMQKKTDAQRSTPEENAAFKSRFEAFKSTRPPEPEERPREERDRTMEVR